MIPYSRLFVDPYKQYKTFVEECRLKRYPDTLVLHNHHIIPRCLGGEDVPSNIVTLSVEDHAWAHILLSRCFDPDVDASIHNIRAANIINSKSIRDKEDLMRLSVSRKGKNNPFFGKTHTPETLAQIQQTKTANLSTNKDKTYQDIYGSLAQEEKLKRQLAAKCYWAAIDPAARAARAAAVRLACSTLPRRTGLLNPRSKRVRVNGTEYDSASLACKDLQVSRYFLFKKFNVEFINE